jgi:hypothetical protein
MIIHVKNIEWETDGEDPAQLGLPFHASVDVDDEEDVADALSDEYGWLVRGYELEDDDAGT